MPRYQKRYTKKKATGGLPKNRKDATQDQRLMNIEKKVKTIQHDVQLKYSSQIFNLTPIFNPTTPPYAQNLVLLNGIPIVTSATVGVQNIRVAAQLRMTSILWNFMVTLKIATTGQTEGGLPIRMIIFIDHSPAGNIASISGNPIGGFDSLLDSTLSYPLITQFQQYEQIKRFTIIKDKTYDMNPASPLSAAGASAGALPITRTLRGYKKLGQTVKYDSGGDQISSITRNALYVLFIVGAPSTTPNYATYTVSGGTRLYWKDA